MDRHRTVAAVPARDKAADAVTQADKARAADADKAVTLIAATAATRDAAETQAAVQKEVSQL